MQFGEHTYIESFTNVYLNLEIECPVFYLTALFPPDTLDPETVYLITTFCLAFFHLPARWGFLYFLTLMHSILSIWEAGMDSSHSYHILQLIWLSATETTWLFFK